MSLPLRCVRSEAPSTPLPTVPAMDCWPRASSASAEGGSAGSIVELSGDFEAAIDRNLRLHGVLVRPERETLDRLREAVEQGALRPVVDAVVGPDAIVRTHRALETGPGVGKVVLRLADDAPG